MFPKNSLIEFRESSDTKRLVVSTVIIYPQNRPLIYLPITFALQHFTPRLAESIKEYVNPPESVVAYMEDIFQNSTRSNLVYLNPILNEEDEELVGDDLIAKLSETLGKRERERLREEEKKLDDSLKPPKSPQSPKVKAEPKMQVEDGMNEEFPQSQSIANQAIETEM